MRILFLLSAVLVLASAQMHAQGVSNTQNGNRNNTNIRVLELGNVIDSLQTALDLTPIEVVPQTQIGNSNRARLDKRALAQALTAMYEELGIEEEIPSPQRLNARAVLNIMSTILLAAAETPPTVQTLIADGIESALATLNGIITKDGRVPLLYWGFKMGTDSSLSDSTLVPFGDYQGFLDTSEVDTGSFSFEKTALSRYTTYYYTAWGENEHGIGHGDTLSFTTLPELATGLAISSSNVTKNSADVSLTFTDNGGQGPDTVGFWWDDESFALDSFAGDSIVSTSNSSPYGASLSGLTRYTKYYYTGYMANLAGRAFVNEPDSFVTSPEIPLISALWNAAGNQFEATITDLGGNAGTPLPDSTFIVLGDDSTLNDGDTLVTTYNATDSSFVGTGEALLLEAGQAYHAAAFAANPAGIGSSDTLAFNTLVTSTTSAEILNINGSSATIQGSFDYNTATPSQVGFIWGSQADLSNASDSLITESADSTIQLKLMELPGSTTYYYSAYATNAAGTSYGDTLSFTTKIAITQTNLFAAVNAWYADSVAAEISYGHISDWDVSNTGWMAGLFEDKTDFNSDVSGWDVSNVTNMSRMFQSCAIFNQDLSNWDVSSVTNLKQLFFGCDSLNTDLSSWDVSNVTDFYRCFSGCKVFNSDLSSWDVSSANDMGHMFKDCHEFNYPLNNWDVSSVTDMRYMFYRAKKFNQNLADWDVSSVTSMSSMFNGAHVFNQPIEGWNVGNVEKMDFIFSQAYAFNQSLDAWDVSSVTDINAAFSDCYKFNQDLNSWDLSSVIDMNSMFRGDSLFNGAISSWNTSSVTDMYGMFDGCLQFNQDLSSWDVSSLTDCGYMFANTVAFDQDLNAWNTSAAKTMVGMFKKSNFNGNISNWDVASVTNMVEMFNFNKAFNGDLSSWDVSSVKDASFMFAQTDFNGDISSWDVGNVTNFNNMFHEDSLFNQNINGWNISSANTLKSMFENAISFNQDLNSWDVSSVTTLEKLFKNSNAFQGDISSWDVSSVTSMAQMFGGGDITFDGDFSTWDVSSVTNFALSIPSTISTENYDKLLAGWSTVALQPSMTFNLVVEYCYGAGARQSIIDNFGWTFSDRGSACDPAPSATSGPATNVTTTTADLDGSFANMSTVSGAGFKLGTDSTAVDLIFTSADIPGSTTTSSFSVQLTDLTPNTIYYYRSYATDELGTAEENSTKSFQTTGLPLVSTIADTTWTDTTAMLTGSLDFVVIPTVTATGFKWGSQADLSDATDVTGSALTDTFTYALTASGPLYYAAYATNALGTTYGDTIQLVSELTFATSAASNVTDTGAKLNATLSSGRNAISATGFIWGYQEDLSDATQVAVNELTSDFSEDLTGLTAGATIYFSAYYTDETGTTYGDTLSRCLTVCEPVEFDGYTYETVAIGCQCWFAENLRSDNYDDGTAIPGVSNSSVWGSRTEGGQTFYNNDSTTYFEDYGRMYNWYAANDARGLCPSGWHVPTWTEWLSLGQNVGGSMDLKASASDSPSWNGTNASGFTATPGGFLYSGTWYSIGDQGRWWTSTVNETSGNPMSVYMSSWDNSVTGSQDGISIGVLSSVRCLRDAD